MPPPPPRTFICPKGHTWQSQGGGRGASGPALCPRCGALGKDDPEQTRPIEMGQPIGGDRTISAETTLPTPLPSPRRDRSTMGLDHSLPDRTQQPTGHLGSILTHLASTLGGTVGGPAAAGGAGNAGGGGASTPGVPVTHYTILRQHARGGLGCVNLARDEVIGREVALKQILPHVLDNPAAQTRFLYEARITGRLEHPGIVPVYTMGSDAEGRPYYVMKFVRGRTLDEHIVDYFAYPNLLVFRELLRRFIAVCQAIAYAHSRGVIHRDLKPSNIMLGDYGETLVLDWGLAKDLKEKGGGGGGDRGKGLADKERTIADTPSSPNTIITTTATNTAGNLTQDGQIVGTPAYMSPEQASGRADLHGPATDIYALGGILYKLLTGKAPNVGKATSALTLQNYTPPPPPSSLRKDVPPVLEAIAMKAMSLRPQDRHQQAMELADAVQRWLDDTPPLPGKQTRLARFGRWCRENPVLVLIWAALGLAVLATGMFVLTYFR